MYSFNDRMFTLIAGTEKREFKVDRRRLGNSSMYLEKTLEQDWEEGQKKRVPLEDVEPHTLRCYLHLLYTGTILCCEQVDATESKNLENYDPIFQGSTSIEDLDMHTQEYDLLANLYVLGERLMDGRLKDAVVDAIIAKVNEFDENGDAWYPTISTVHIMYKGTPNNS